MPAPDRSPFEQWIEAARCGSNESLGQMLEACRQYLLLVATQEINLDLQPKLGASDVVQETFLDAQQAFPGFEGRTEGDLLAWLRRILLNNLANLRRHYRDTEKRNVRREVALPQTPASELVNACVMRAGSPSAQAIAREQDAVLDQALQQLPTHYRQVIVWRHREHYSFEKIAQLLNRTPRAAQKLWARAIECLQQTVEAHE